MCLYIRCCVRRHHPYIHTVCVTADRQLNTTTNIGIYAIFYRSAPAMLASAEAFSLSVAYRQYSQYTCIIHINTRDAHELIHNRRPSV